MPITEFVLTETFQARFWSKVEKVEGGCWNWTASKNTDGYGRIRVNIKLQRAHRVSWVIHNGPIPAGMHTLHRCDNPGCVNPAHLFLGTHADNMRDRDQKGRGADRIGVKCGMSKLTPEEVRAIRAAYPEVPVLVLAEKYHVSKWAIRDVIYRRTWAHIN